MSYEGQLALADNDFSRVSKNNFIGLYHRVNTNRITAFTGPGKTPDEWRKLFSHYVNIEVCEMLLEALEWHQSYSSDVSILGPDACGRVAKSFGYDDIDCQPKLKECIEISRNKLELYINNSSMDLPTLSLLQAPIDRIIKEIGRIEFFKNKLFYIILDEFENYLDYQQIVLNTLIKHAGSGYVFKIGVRDLGWRVKSTLNPTEQLVSPADYELINIDNRLSDTFPAFAREVCETRLAMWYRSAGLEEKTLDALLPDISIEKEAELLGVESKIFEFRNFLSKSPLSNKLSMLTGLNMYVFLAFNQYNFDEAYKDIFLFINGDKHQVDRYNNYKYAYLFSITGKGSEIPKYYCGTDVFAKISRNNIRFFLQLVTESIARHMAEDNPVTVPISVENQTKAARDVGLQYLTELEGVTVHGVQLVKLLLGLGRFFQILSMNPFGGSPECNQFHLKTNAKVSKETVEAATRLLRYGVMHLALVRSPGTKLATESDTREWDYSPHPIFAPFFNFSHRRKRKVDLTEEDILHMVDRPQDTIRRLLKNRAPLFDQEVPRQLRLFDDYYLGANADS
ncbi:hypothetical protein CIT25_34990 [Mesorhizobium mediterraneum]|uniref:Uncharacterized protein n=2 Tax=Mesorhizobium mediterraneum TaxID=43617 RepID=A0AB36R0I7_9HYPH|nr:hypothetical protein CIT25_34990 [Mesorhizobium mediterraneum]